MNKELHSLQIPTGFKIVKNEFYNYDPETEFNKEDSFYCLQEDILQFEFNNLVIDLGWYGDTETNDGNFRLVVIFDSNWDEPLKKIVSKSGIAIKNELNNLLMKLYFQKIVHNKM